MDVYALAEQGLTEEECRFIIDRGDPDELRQARSSPAAGPRSTDRTGSPSASWSKARRRPSPRGPKYHYTPSGAGIRGRERQGRLLRQMDRKSDAAPRLRHMNDHEPSNEVLNEALKRLLDVTETGMSELAALAEFKTADEAIAALELMPARQMRRMLLAYAQWQQGVYGTTGWLTGAPPDLVHWLD